jgi:hypothetical protein
MADVAIIQAGGRQDVILFHQLFSKRRLVARRQVSHREDLISGADVVLRVAMTFQAPFHVKRVGLPGKWHTVHAPVTGFAANPLGNMDAVIEVDEIGQIVHAHPLDRYTAAIAFPDGFQDWRIKPDLAVTGHASFDGWNISKRRCFHGNVAVTAVNSQAGYVVLVAERHRLLNRVIDPDRKRRAKKGSKDKRTAKPKEYCPKNASLENGIHASMEDLRHSLIPVWRLFRTEQFFLEKSQSAKICVHLATSSGI